MNKTGLSLSMCDKPECMSLLKLTNYHLKKVLEMCSVPFCFAHKNRQTSKTKGFMVEQQRQRDEYTSWVIVMVLCRWWSLLSMEIFVFVCCNCQQCLGKWICKNERKETSEFRTRRWLKSTNRIAVLLKFLMRFEHNERTRYFIVWCVD